MTALRHRVLVLPLILLSMALPCCGGDEDLRRPAAFVDATTPTFVPEKRMCTDWDR